MQVGGVARNTAALPCGGLQLHASRWKEEPHECAVMRTADCNCIYAAGWSHEIADADAHGWISHVGLICKVFFKRDDYTKVNLILRERLRRRTPHYVYYVIRLSSVMTHEIA